MNETTTKQMCDRCGCYAYTLYIVGQDSTTTCTIYPPPLRYLCQWCYQNFTR